MSEGKDLSELQHILAAGDAWLRKYGIVDNPIAHNSIILNLYMNFPKVQYVEYFLYPPPHRKIHVVMHFKFLDLLFRNKDRLIEDVISLLREYLFDYEITVEFKRFKRGVRGRNEVLSNYLDNPSQPSTEGIVGGGS